MSHITFRDCRVHIFSVDLSRNSCMAMGLRCARSLLQNLASYAKIQPTFKQMFMSNKLNCFKQAEVNKKSVSCVLEDVITLRQHSCFDKTKLTKWWPSKLNNNQKVLLQSAVWIFCESATAYFITKCNGSKLRQLFSLFYYKVRQGLSHCDKNYKTWQLLPLATVRAFLHHSSTVPPLPTV